MCNFPGPYHALHPDLPPCVPAAGDKSWPGGGGKKQLPAGGIGCGQNKEWQDKVNRCPGHRCQTKPPPLSVGWEVRVE